MTEMQQKAAESKKTKTKNTPPLKKRLQLIQSVMKDGEICVQVYKQLQPFAHIPR